MLSTHQHETTQTLVKRARPDDVALMVELLQDRHRFFAALFAATAQCLPGAEVSVALEHIAPHQSEFERCLRTPPIITRKTVIEITEPGL